ncbi:MAG: hypothetical protein CML99_04125 [Rhodobiaceae bacterium]|nr:hypothetical protein [Rhodobiaceae bacterium]
MNEIVIASLVMAGVLGAAKLLKKFQAAARTRIEEQVRAPEPRDLGTLTRRSDGSFAPDNQAGGAS